jgi:hypothetical protein
MSEEYPSQADPEHMYPHQLGEVNAIQLAADIAQHPDAYHPGLDPHMQVNGIDVQRQAFEPPTVEMQTAGDQIAAPPEEPNSLLHYKDLARGWQYDENGQLQRTGVGHIRHLEQASDIVNGNGPIADDGIAFEAAQHLNNEYDTTAARNTRQQDYLERLEAIPVTEDNAQNLEFQKQQVRAQIMDLRETYEGSQAIGSAEYVIRNELAEQEKAMLEQAIQQRIASDRLPWTMPESELPAEVMEIIHEAYVDIVKQNTEPNPQDMFKVAQPMKKFEGSERYAVEDEVLLAAGGEQRNGLLFTRETLQNAGIFFVNRVGGGEQPIFGMPIPDPDSENGVFNVQDRSFLTRAEFEKVYRYQQEHGYGLGGLDPADVQTDMIAFAVLPRARKEGARKGYGGASRENKYGQVRSPFVDQGFLVTNSIGGDVYDSDGSMLRMNTTTIHLANGHPDYPGVSEMFADEAVAHDQRYMSAGYFARNFYAPLPTEQVTLARMSYGARTDREIAWVELPKEMY